MLTVTNATEALTIIRQLIHEGDDTYYATGELVELALAHNLTLTVEMDPGTFELAGEDLRAEWDALAPGEAFDVQGAHAEQGNEAEWIQPGMTVYTTPNCSGCTATKHTLDAKGIDYAVVDLSDNPQALEEVKDLGYAQAPVVILRDAAGSITDHWSGFRPDKIVSLQS